MDMFIWQINGCSDHSNLALEKGIVKCQFGMAVCAKENAQAAENELTAWKETLKKAHFQQKPPSENQKEETQEATAEKSKPKS